MKIREITLFDKVPQLRYAVYAAVAVVLSIADFLLIPLVEIQGVVPDIIVILVVWIAISEGQLLGIVSGFLCGLLVDFLSYEGVLGVHALVNTLAGFTAGYFFKESRTVLTLQSYRFVLILFLATFVHNTIFSFLYIRTTEATLIEFFTKYVFAKSVYTIVFGTIPVLFRSLRN